MQVLYVQSTSGIAEVLENGFCRAPTTVLAVPGGEIAGILLREAGVPCAEVEGEAAVLLDVPESALAPFIHRSGGAAARWFLVPPDVPHGQRIVAYRGVELAIRPQGSPSVWRRQGLAIAASAVVVGAVTTAVASMPAERDPKDVQRVAAPPRATALAQGSAIRPSRTRAQPRVLSASTTADAPRRRASSSRSRPVAPAARALASIRTRPRKTPPRVTKKAATKDRSPRRGGVRGIQNALGVRVTGKFDRVTEKALQRLQRARGLEADGVAGPQTRAALGLPEGGTLQRPESAQQAGRTPSAVDRVIAGADAIATAPYRYGGGHGSFEDSAYDCSGSVSYALHAAGLLAAPMASSGFMGYGLPGPGEHITIYSNPGHMFMTIDGRRFDTSARSATGTRWSDTPRAGAGYVVRHPPGL